MRRGPCALVPESSFSGFWVLAFTSPYRRCRFDSRSAHLR